MKFYQGNPATRGHAGGPLGARAGTMYERSRCTACADRAATDATQCPPVHVTDRVTFAPDCSGACMNGALRSWLIFVDAKIGWHRVGVLLSLTIITIAGVVLYRMLRQINFEDVIDAVAAVEKHDVAKA